MLQEIERKKQRSARVVPTDAGDYGRALGPLAVAAAPDIWRLNNWSDDVRIRSRVAAADPAALVAAVDELRGYAAVGATGRYVSATGCVDLF